MKTLQGYGVTLEPVKHSDIEMVRNWRNDPNVAGFMHFRDHITREMQEKWFQSINSPSNAYFIIFIDNRPVGMTELKKIDHAQKTAEGGIFFHDSTLRHSIYPYAVILLRNRFGFNDLKLNSLYAHILDDNHRAIRFNRSLGYIPTEQCEEPGKRLYILTRDRFFESVAKYRNILEKL
ncbi:GNAT family N-acetyltransferase [Desulfonatronospira sp.]|uniref:GNAT family N-acetyltransferase n=1 Tax=Desulfonatronospira sp. TaxID=1962951 RepID=UPI0025BB5989|nr:GNAT family N-acetyltransferase [Desulfonatronospira sp.]